jgi:hypothetical protein
MNGFLKPRGAHKQFTCSDVSAAMRRAIEKEALSQFNRHVGRRFAVTELSGYIGNYSHNLILENTAIVRVVKTDKAAICHWNDEWLDPYWDVEMIHGHIRGLPPTSCWIDGPSAIALWVDRPGLDRSVSLGLNRGDELTHAESQAPRSVACGIAPSCTTISRKAAWSTPRRSAKGCLANRAKARVMRITTLAGSKASDIGAGLIPSSERNSASMRLDSRSKSASLTVPFSANRSSRWRSASSLARSRASFSAL